MPKLRKLLFIPSVDRIKEQLKLGQLGQKIREDLAGIKTPEKSSSKLEIATFRQSKKRKENAGRSSYKKTPSHQVWLRIKITVERLSNIPSNYSLRQYRP